MRTRQALGSGALLTTLLLAGCGTAVDDEPEPATTTTSAEPTPTTTPDPTPTPTPTPEPEPAASAELCEQVYTALEQTQSLHPDTDVAAAALDEAASTADPELLPGIEAMAEDLQEYVDFHETPDVAPPWPELELTPDEALTSSCAATGTDLTDVPTQIASVEDTCHELHQIVGWQDPRGLDLQEIVDYYVDRARAHTPPEIEQGVHAFGDRMQPYADPAFEETEEDHAARLALGETCEDLGMHLLQVTERGTGADS